MMTEKGQDVVEEVGQLPASGPLVRRATAAMLLPRKPRPATAPSARLLVRGVRVERNHLARYARVCGFSLTDALPPTYPHVLGFGLALQLMTRDDFPFPLAGLVHLENGIEQRQALTAAMVFDLSVHAEQLREHERGQVIDVLTTVTVDGTPAWQERASYLRRSATAIRATRPEASKPPPAAALWRVGREVGTAYARVSGDRNPIHTSMIGARLFGFRRPIAHGMWTLARCLAALAGRVPAACEVAVSFKLPVPLPSMVAFSASPDRGGGWRFGLHAADDGRPHLAGTVTPPAP